MTKFDKEMKKSAWTMKDKGKTTRGGRWKRDQGFISQVSMKIRTLSWNVRGANDTEKRKIIKAFLKT